MSPLGGARSTGVDQRMTSKGCAAAEETPVCCGFPAKVIHPSGGSAAPRTGIANTARSGPTSNTPSARSKSDVPERMSTPPGFPCGVKARCPGYYNESVPRQRMTVTHLPPRQSDEPEEQMNPVDGATGQPADHGAVDPDVLEIVAGVLLDEPDGPLGPQRVDPALDEDGDPVLVAPDERGRLRLEPSVEVPPERAIGGHHRANPLELVDEPGGELRSAAPEVVDQGPVEPDGDVVDELRHHRAREQLRLGGLDASRQLGLSAQARGQLGQDLGEAPSQGIVQIGRAHV